MTTFPLRQRLIGNELYVSTTDIAAMLTSAVDDWRLFASVRPEWETPLEACAEVVEGVLDQLTVTAIAMMSTTDADRCPGSGMSLPNRQGMHKYQCPECGRYCDVEMTGVWGRHVFRAHDKPTWTAQEIVRDHLNRKGETW